MSEWIKAAGLTCPAALPSIPPATCPFSFHCTGGTICWRVSWSCLPARSSAAACCLLYARSSESVRRGEGTVKGEGEREWVSQKKKKKRKRERIGGRESAARAQVYLPQPIKPASLGDSAKSTAGPCVMSEPQQPVTAAEASRRYGALTEPKSPAKWGSSLATLL